MVFLATSLITGAIQLSGYAVAYALQTEKFYDILGGLNFLAVAAYSAATADGWAEDPRKVAATLIFVCSRGWLLAFLSWRAHERGGDARFDGVKDKARSGKDKARRGFELHGKFSQRHLRLREQEMARRQCATRESPTAAPSSGSGAGEVHARK